MKMDEAEKESICIPFSYKSGHNLVAVDLLCINKLFRAVVFRFFYVLDVRLGGGLFRSYLKQNIYEIFKFEHTHTHSTNDNSVCFLLESCQQIKATTFVVHTAINKQQEYTAFAFLCVVFLL